MGGRASDSFVMAQSRWISSQYESLSFCRKANIWTLLSTLTLISIVQLWNSRPSTRSDLSVRCWLIVWWNWFIHVFTLRPTPHYISSHLIFTVLYQLPLYYITISYLTISYIIISLYHSSTDASLYQLLSHIHCAHCIESTLTVLS